MDLHLGLVGQMKKLVILCAVSLTVLLLSSLVFSTGCPLRTSGVSMSTCVDCPGVISDGSGDAIAVYQLRKGGDFREVYAQRVSPQGDLLWGERGTLVGSGYVFQCESSLRIVNDDSGGALIVWKSYPSRVNLDLPPEERVRSVITITKVDSQGKIMWHREIKDFKKVKYMISDGAGGVIIARGDNKSGYLCIQKIDAEGDLPWGEDGVLIHCEGNGYDDLELVSDGAGGAVVMWWESDAETESRIFAQRVDSSGNLSWGRDGVLLYTTLGEVAGQRVTSDGSGGVTAVWLQSDWGWPKHYDVCAQRVDADGNIMWQSENAPIFIRSQMEHAADPIPVSDSSGGTTIFWESNVTIYAQRLNLAGETSWSENGIQVWQGGDTPRLTCKVDTDGLGGALIAWYYIGGKLVDKGEILRVQKLDADGRLIWQDDGVPVATGVKENCNYAAISQDGLGGALITWGTGRDVYTVEKSYLQRIDAEGNPLWGDEGIRLSP